MTAFRGTQNRLSTGMKAAVHTPKIDFERMPGHYIRRLQQIAVAIFLEETQTYGLTPVQFAALSAVMQRPDIDQRTLARTIGFDSSTIGGVIDRLEKRGLMKRSASADDRRVRLLTVTPEGTQLLREILPKVKKAQHRMLEPLPADKRAEFFEMIRIIVEANNDLSRAPRIE